MTPHRRLRIQRKYTDDIGQPYCVDCGTTDGPFEIDHGTSLRLQAYYPDRDLEADDNLFQLCVPCHKAKSALEAAREAKVKRLSQRFRAFIHNMVTAAGAYQNYRKQERAAWPKRKLPTKKDKEEWNERNRPS